MRELASPPGLQVWQQIQLPAVVGPVMDAAERHDAQRMAAPSERARDQVRRVDSAIGSADDAAPSGHRGSLGVGRGH
jgi:hypothetical protein